MNQHTQGPWDCDYNGDGKRIIVGQGLVDGPNGYDVAEVYSDDCDINEAVANARLIAAAPDLLAALVEITDSLQGEIADRYMGMLPQLQARHDRDMVEVVNARAAIRKATGEPS